MERRIFFFWNESSTEDPVGIESTHLKEDPQVALILLDVPSLLLLFSSSFSSRRGTYDSDCYLTCSRVMFGHLRPVVYDGVVAAHHLSVTSVSAFVTGGIISLATLYLPCVVTPIRIRRQYSPSSVLNVIIYTPEPNREGQLCGIAITHFSRYPILLSYRDVLVVDHASCEPAIQRFYSDFPVLVIRDHHTDAVLSVMLRSLVLCNGSPKQTAGSDGRPLTNSRTDAKYLTQ